MLSASQGRPPLLFIAPRAKLAVAPSLGKTRGHRTLTRSHRKLNPQRPVLTRQPRVTSRLNSTIAANGYCARAPAQHHRTLYCVTPDTSDAHGPMRRELRKLAGSPDASHRRDPEHPVLTGHMRREGRQTARAPDAEHRTHCGASGALCTPAPQTDTTPDALDQRLVLPTPASGECFSVATSPKNPTGTIENIHLIFSKALNPAEREGERNPHPSQP